MDVNPTKEDNLSLFIMHAMKEGNWKKMTDCSNQAFQEYKNRDLDNPVIYKCYTNRIRDLYNKNEN